MMIYKKLFFLTIGLTLICSMSFAVSSVTAATLQYEGFWKGTTNQAYDVELLIKDEKVTLKITMYIAGNYCTTTTTSNTSNIPLNNGSFSTSSSSSSYSSTYSGSFNYDDDRWEGTWSYSFNTGYPTYCSGSASGTWTASERAPRISISPESFEKLEVVTNFSSPGHWPRGLAFDGTYLWNVDYWDKKIYKLDTSGNIIDSLDSPGDAPYGLTFDGTYLWNTDYWDKKIYKLDTAGNTIDSFDSPGNGPYDLAFDGTYLWNADDTDDKIYKLDTSGNIIVSFNSPGSDPYGLTFDGTYLWNADNTDKKIYKMDTSGNILNSFDSPGDSPYGLTFDGTYLWNADFSSIIYKLKLPSVMYLGLSKIKTFTITNLGSDDLIIDTLSISGQDEAEFTIESNSCSGQTLGVFETCTFNVNFSPSSLGEKSANLELSSNDQDTPTLNVPLSGSVVQAPSEGVIEFNSFTYDVDENAVTATITLSRLLGSEGAVSVHYSTSDGSGVEGLDYTGASGTINWEDGDEAEKTFRVNIIDNNTVEEDNKTINLAISDPGGGAELGPRSTAVLTIINDDVQEEFPWELFIPAITGR